MRDYLLAAQANLIAGNPAATDSYLRLALGVAKRTGQSFAAGRILTAIQWVKMIEERAS